MKKHIVIPLLILPLLLCGCGPATGGNASHQPSDNCDISVTSSERDNNTDIEEDSEMDEVNRKTLAKALGVKEDTRSLRFLIGALNTIEAGQIKSAKKTRIDGDSALKIEAEDGTHYIIYLTSSGGPDAVYNEDTGEWPVRSDR